MNTKMTNKDWSIGELVTLERDTTLLKKCGKKLYSYFQCSQYVCIREASKGQRGILVKGLGKVRRERVMLVSGKPFCKDEREELFVGKHYYSYPFPTVDELKEVLNIIRSDIDLQQQLIDNYMFFYPEGTFWVSDTKSLFLWLKQKPQYYDPSTGYLATAKSCDEHHQRLTIVYF